MPADNVNLDSVALQQLQAEQKTLLDTIDRMRSLGVGNYVDLPQIIVVGDQSSGKSSVLEAISRVRFPREDGICTRFATELQLRTAPQTEVSVRIIAAEGNVASKERYQAFNDSQSNTSFSGDDLPEIIERAKRAMGINGGTVDFSEDTLRIEVAGPSLPMLTLVDLPGIYHAGTEDQSATGKAVVDRLVNRYMRNENSVILAIVAANNGLMMQLVVEKTKGFDPDRKRTLGVITKPDLLKPGSTDEAKYIRLANNKEASHTLRLGWHVLRNRDGSREEEAFSAEERDNKEAEFFETGMWASVPVSNRGIEALREKLSGVLFDHVKKSLPGMIGRINEVLEEKEARLKQLGEPRSNPKEHRIYLLHMADIFQKLANAAVGGKYTDSFFGGLDREHDAKRLRAQVRKLNRAFGIVVDKKGAAQELVSDDDKRMFYFEPTLLGTDLEYLMPVINSYPAKQPQRVTFKELRPELVSMAASIQGTEFPGSTNDELAWQLFRRQSRPWRSIGEFHLKLVVKAAREFVERLFQHVVAADKKVYEALIRELVNPFFEAKEQALQEKLDEILRPYESGYAQPLDDEFQYKMAHKWKKRHAEDVKKSLEKKHPGAFDSEMPTLTGPAVLDVILSAKAGAPSEFGIESVVDKSAVYYGLSMKTFTDNVVSLVVEQVLVVDIVSILSSRKVGTMDDDDLKRLVAESKQVEQERRQVQAARDALREGLRSCSAYRTSEPVTPAAAGRPLFEFGTPTANSTTGINGTSGKSPKPNKTPTANGSPTAAGTAANGPAKSIFETTNLTAPKNTSGLFSGVNNASKSSPSKGSAGGLFPTLFSPNGSASSGATPPKAPSPFARPN